jgi:hypothetical protein
MDHRLFILLDGSLTQAVLKQDLYLVGAVYGVVRVDAWHAQHPQDEVR